jgi:hypothetical protein
MAEGIGSGLWMDGTAEVVPLQNPKQFFVVGI